MVNRRMSMRQALALVRLQARRHDLSVVEMVKRGKGSHRVHLVVDRAGKEVGRITLTDHTGDLSWTVLRDVEQKLSHLFGPKWMENRR